MIMTLKDNQLLNVENIIAPSDLTLEITFEQGTTYSEIATIYDPASESFDKDRLREFTLSNEEGVVHGKHVGYTEPTSIVAFDGYVKVTVVKENEIETNVILASEKVEELEVLTSNMTKVIANTKYDVDGVKIDNIDLFDIVMSMQMEILDLKSKL